MKFLITSADQECVCLVGTLNSTHHEVEKKHTLAPAGSDVTGRQTGGGVAPISTNFVQTGFTPPAEHAHTDIHATHTHTHTHPLPLPAPPTAKQKLM